MLPVGRNVTGAASECARRSTRPEALRHPSREIVAPRKEARGSRVAEAVGAPVRDIEDAVPIVHALA